MDEGKELMATASVFLLRAGGMVLFLVTASAMVMPHEEVHKRTEEEQEKRPALCDGRPLERESEAQDADDDCQGDQEWFGHSVKGVVSGS